MDPLLLRLVFVVGLTAAVVAFGAWWQRRDGRVRAGDGGAVLAADHLDAVGLAVPSGGVGAVLLGSPTCTPCTAVKRVLRDLQAERGDVAWVYADAADHLDLAAEHKVMRVPTLFLVDDAGRVLARTSGVPQLADLRRVLDDGTPLDDDVAA
ncbi:MAG: thioredoxin family protein [Actinobacteria bacterium]|jgi:thiol-disulfide isomerase/thioredoxin|nr:thioredoxin family protein [Actinomycetota bacterium]